MFNVDQTCYSTWFLLDMQVLIQCLSFMFFKLAFSYRKRNLFVLFCDVLTCLLKHRCFVNRTGLKPVRPLGHDALKLEKITIKLPK